MGEKLYNLLPDALKKTILQTGTLLKKTKNLPTTGKATQKDPH